MTPNRRRVVSVRKPSTLYGRPARPMPNSQRRKLPKINLRLSAIVFIGLFLFIAWSQIFSIRRVVFQGNKSLSEVTLDTAVRSELQRSFWSQNLTTVDTDALAKTLQDHMYQIKTAEIVRLWPNGIRLSITERVPSLIWKTGNKSYLLDIDGTVIAATGEGSKLPVIVDGSNLPVKVGERVVGARFVEFCVGLVQAMAGRTGVNITGLSIPDTTTEVYVTTSKGYVVKFDTTRSVDEALASLNRVLSELTRLKKPQPTEYVDLRIAGKAYYK